MLGLCRLYLGIALLRGSPADVPPGTRSVWTAVAVASAVYVSVGSLGSDVSLAFSRSVLDLALTALLMAITVSAFGLPERFSQAYAAVCGSGAVVNLAALPLMWRIAALPDGVEPGGGYLLPWLLLMAWLVAIQAHVLRLTLQTTRGIAVALACGYLMIAFIAFDLVFGG